MSLTSGLSSLVHPGSWNWYPVDRDESPVQTFPAPGQKRRLEQSTDTADSSAKRPRPQHSPPNSARSSRAPESTPFTMRSPRPSPSTRVDSFQFSGNRPAAKPAPSQSNNMFGSKSMPFQIDSDDSDDEMDISAPAAFQRTNSPKRKPDSDRFPSLPADLAQQQRLDSARMREEARKRAAAKQKTTGSFNSSSTMGRSNKSISPPPLRKEESVAHEDRGITSFGNNGNALKKSPTAEGFSFLHRERSTNASNAAPRTLTKFDNAYASPAPRNTPAQSVVIDLSGDDEDEVAQPTITHQANRTHSGLHQTSRKLDFLEKRQAGAKEAAEQQRAAQVSRDEEQRKKVEQEGLANIAAQRQKEAEKKAADAAEEDRQRKLRQAAALRQRQEQEHAQRRRTTELDFQGHLQQQDRAREDEQRRNEDNRLQQHQPRQEALRIQAQKDREEREEREERERANQRAMAQQWADHNARKKREEEQSRQRQDARLQQYKQRQEQDRIKAEEERKQREEEAKAHQREMSEQWADFNARKAEADRKQAEKKKAAEAQARREEEKKKLEREKRKREAFKPVSEQERAQMQRIQKQQARNAQNRFHDDDDDEDGLIVDEDPDPQTYRPVSLNTLAKQEQRQQTASGSGNSFKPVMFGTGARNPTFSLPSHQSRPSTVQEYDDEKLRFREITHDDTKLLLWKSPEWNHTWGTISELFEKRLLKKRAPDYPRKRHGELMTLLKKANVDEDTMEELYRGGEEILDQVNRMVDHVRYTPLYPETKEQRRQEQQVKKQQNAPTRQPTAQKTGPLDDILSKMKPKPSNTFSKIKTGGTQSREVGVPPAAPPRPQPLSLPQRPNERPTTGGKTLSWEAMQHYFGDAAETWQDLQDEAEEEKKKGIDPSDYVYNVYRVYRREWTLEDLERCEHPDEEEPEWMECQFESEDLDEANEVASTEVLKAIPGRPIFASNITGFNFESNPKEDGLGYWTLDNKKVGSVEVQVCAITRTAEDRILPSSKVRELSKTLWVVKQKTIKKITDEVLGDTERQVEESIVRGGIFRTSKQANEMAAEHFVKLFFKSKESNLHLRDAEELDRIQAILDSLADDGLVNVQDGDDDHMVQVWVEKDKFKGPAN